MIWMGWGWSKTWVSEVLLPQGSRSDDLQGLLFAAEGWPVKLSVAKNNTWPCLGSASIGNGLFCCQILFAFFWIISFLHPCLSFHGVASLMEFFDRFLYLWPLCCLQFPRGNHSLFREKGEWSISYQERSEEQPERRSDVVCGGTHRILDLSSFGSQGYLWLPENAERGERR